MAHHIEFRSIDGSGNNLPNALLSAAGTGFTRIGPARFADGISAPVDGPNPRMISNVVVGEGDPAVANPQGVSGMMYAWGQFIDHDLNLTRSDGVHHIDVAIPAGDPIFADGSVIAITRAIVDPATGTGIQNPVRAVNSITGWLDGSMVYGSNKTVADSLRRPDGHMKSADGGNLPVVNGQSSPATCASARTPRSPRCRRCSCANTTIRSTGSTPSMPTGAASSSTSTPAPLSERRSPHHLFRIPATSRRRTEDRAVSGL